MSKKWQKVSFFGLIWPKGSILDKLLEICYTIFVVLYNNLDESSHSLISRKKAGFTVALNEMRKAAANPSPCSATSIIGFHAA